MKESLGKKAIERIAQGFILVDRNFDDQQFKQHAQRGLDGLELKARVAHIIEALAKCLPKDFESSAVLLKQIKPVWIQGDENDSFQSLAAWPVIDYVAVHGINYPDIALPLLEHLTSLFSAEFAVRAFINRYPLLVEQYFSKWVENPDEHVRRLVSEGTRPRLPWGNRLAIYIAEPATNLKYLDVLKNDPSLYVRRSVANHLNDIAKDHPEYVIDICLSWMKRPSEKVKWVVSHATRSLVKQGYHRVYPLLGFSKEPKLAKLEVSIVNERIKLGESLEFRVDIESGADQDQKLVVDYAIGFVKANGERRDKVFKLKNITLKKGQSLSLKKSHPIKPISTRRYYSGEQSLSVLINGVSLSKAEFNLDCE